MRAEHWILGVLIGLLAVGVVWELLRYYFERPNAFDTSQDAEWEDWRPRG